MNGREKRKSKDVERRKREGNDLKWRNVLERMRQRKGTRGKDDIHVDKKNEKKEQTT